MAENDTQTTETTQPTETTQTAETKPAEATTQPTETKPAETKPAETAKPAEEAKATDAKPTEPDYRAEAANYAARAIQAEARSALSALGVPASRLDAAVKIADLNRIDLKDAKAGEKIAAAAAKDEGPLTLNWPSSAHVFNCRTGEYLGEVSEGTLDIPRADAVFLCRLPYRPQALRALARIADGRLTVQANLAAVANASDHVFRVEVTPPGATAPVLWYSKNVPAPKGSLEWSVPLAQSDPEGGWTVTVKDVATGLQATTGVE